jgi:hypothetical protein
MSSFLTAAPQPTLPVIASTELLCKEDHQPALQLPGCCKEECQRSSGQSAAEGALPASLPRCHKHRLACYFKILARHPIGSQ